MMHLYVLARANKDRLERWVNDVTAQYLPYEYEPGKRGLLQVAVRPVQLLEIAFPKEHLEEVLAMVQPYSEAGKRQAGILRRILGLRKIPGKQVKCSMRVIPNDVAVTAIGIKDDYERPNKIENI